jgi:hypothetical protein
MKTQFFSSLKAYAAGVAAFLGSVAVILAGQPVDHQGVQYVTQLEWINITIFVLASYGITWSVPNTPAVPPMVIQPGQGDHVA